MNLPDKDGVREKQREEKGGGRKALMNLMLQWRGGGC